MHVLLDVKTHARLVALAQREHRTLGAEIRVMLEAYEASQPRPEPQPVTEIIHPPYIVTCEAK